MKSEAFEWFVGDMCKVQGADLRDCFAHSICVSADVTAAFDPNYPEVSEKLNTARLNYGVGLHKFTGSRGKAGTNDAPAELVAYMRRDVYKRQRLERTIYLSDDRDIEHKFVRGRRLF